MRMRVAEDILPGSELHEQLHDGIVVAALLRASEEFAIGKGTGSPFAETIVGFSVDLTASAEIGYVYAP